jgi:hypothetical protein
VKDDTKTNNKLFIHEPTETKGRPRNFLFNNRKLIDKNTFLLPTKKRCRNMEGKIYKTQKMLENNKTFYDAQIQEKSKKEK